MRTVEDWKHKLCDRKQTTPCLAKFPLRTRQAVNLSSYFDISVHYSMAVQMSEGGQQQHHHHPSFFFVVHRLPRDAVKELTALKRYTAQVSNSNI
jgi:hypothetical protein